MDNRQNDAVEQAEGDEAIFAVLKAVVRYRYGNAVTQRLDISKVNAMFADVGLTFGLIPLELHASKCSDKL